MRRSTEQQELVDTHEIAKALKRLDGRSPCYDSQRWRRSLYHAILIAGVGNHYAGKVREALELP